MNNNGSAKNKTKIRSEPNMICRIAVGFYLAYDTHRAISFIVGRFPYMSNPTR